MFDDALRRKVASFEMKPEGHVLENILSSESLHARRGGRKRWFFMMMLFLSGSGTVTMALVLGWNWLSGDNATRTAEVAEAWVPMESLFNNSSRPASLQTEPAEITVQAVEATTLVSEAATPTLVTQEELVEAVEVTDEAIVEEIGFELPKELMLYFSSLKSSLLAMAPAGAPGMASLQPIWEVITSQKPKNELHFGTHVTFSSTAILNGNTFAMRDEYELSAVNDYGVAYGVTAGYDFKRRIGLQSGVIIHSLQGQRYQGNVSNRAMSQKVLLRYTGVPIYLKLKHQVGNGTLPVVLNALIGGNYANLKMAEMVMDRSLASSYVITDQFKEQDFAMGGGLEADVYLDDNLYVTLGLRATLGKDISVLPLEGREPMRNLLIGVNFGLNFALTK